MIADEALLVHLEQRLAGRVPRRLTPAMAPERLLALLDGMGLALDLDRGLAPSASIFRTTAPGPLPGPQAGALGRPQESR